MRKRNYFITLLSLSCLLASCGTSGTDDTKKDDDSGVVDPDTPDDDTKKDDEGDDSGDDEDPTPVEEEYKFSSTYTIDAYLEELLDAVSQDSFTITYNDGDGEYKDIYTQDYVTVRDEYNGYVLLPSYNKHDSTLKDDNILYSFVKEDGKPVLSLPTVKEEYSYETWQYETIIARSFDDINYIKLAFNESTPLDSSIATLNEDNTVTLQNTSYSSYYYALDDILSIFHNSNITYWNRYTTGSIVLSKTETTYTIEVKMSDTVSYTATISNVNKSKSEIIESYKDSLTYSSEHAGFFNLNHLRDNRYTTKTTVYKVGSEKEVLGVRGSNVSKTKYEFLTYDDSGENITAFSQTFYKDGQVYGYNVDGFNNVSEAYDSYSWENTYYDTATIFDSEGFRVSSTHSYEYFGINYEDIISSLTYLSTSSYGNLRHLYADEGESGEITSFTAVYESVEEDGEEKHIELVIDVLEDKTFDTVTGYTELDEDLNAAFTNSFSGTTSYKAVVSTNDGESTTTPYEIYYDASLKAIIREYYTVDDTNGRTLSSVDGYKILEGTDADGVTYFEYDPTTKTAEAKDLPYDGDVSDLQLIKTSPYVFDKDSETEGLYTIKEGIYNVGKTINFAHSSYYSDDTLQLSLSNGYVSEAKFTASDWWSSSTDTITFTYSSTTPSDYTDALSGITPFIAPTNWVDFDSTVGAKLTSFLGTEELAKEVPFIYTSLVESWSAYTSGDYDSNWDIIEGTEYLNIYPSGYESDDSDAIQEWLDSFNDYIPTLDGWSYVETTSKGKAYSNGSIKVVIGPSAFYGIYVYKL